MKKILLSFILFTSIKSFSQDSSLVMINVALTFKELHFIGKFVHDNDPVFGDLADTIKTKYRGQPDMLEATAVSVRGTIGVWLAVDRFLRNDLVAVDAKAYKNVNDALKLLTTQTFLIRSLATYDVEWVARNQADKQYGKKRNKGSTP